MWNKRNLKHYRKKICDLENENAKLKTEISALKKELRLANDRYESIRNDLSNAAENTGRAQESMRNAIFEADSARREYRQLIADCAALKQEYQKNFMKLLGSIQKDAVVNDK